MPSGGEWRRAKQAFSVAARNRNSWLLHLPANLGLLGLAWAWLWITEATAWRVVLSLLLAAGIALGAVWLHSATFVFYGQAHREPPARLRSAFARVLGHLPACLVLAAVVAALCWAVFRVGEVWLGAGAARLSSTFTQATQTPISPDQVRPVIEGALLGVRWVLIPLVFLPLASRAANGGWRWLRRAGLRESFHVLRRPAWWGWYLLLLMMGAVLPRLLLGWVPEFEGLAAQAASLVLRFGVAYLLLIASWLVLVSLLESRFAGQPQPDVEPGPGE